MMVLVSFLVVVINYNYCIFVCEVVDSVLVQSCVLLQLIVVDDGFIDGLFVLLVQCYGGDVCVMLLMGENVGQFVVFCWGFE